MGPDRWLAISEIRVAMLAEEICSYHKALRENVADSFPAMYSDDHLSLFGYSPGVFDAAIYLASNSENVCRLSQHILVTNAMRFRILIDTLSGFWRGVSEQV